MSKFSRVQIDRMLTANPAAALEYELAQERASALGRLGRQLETALAQLRAFDAARTGDPHEAAKREALLADTAVVLWNFVVQREACGLRDSNRVMSDYGVPREVWLRMGIFPTPRAPRARR